MHVGVLELELSLMGVRSLKEKRGIVKSLVTRLHNQYQVATAEVDRQNLKQSAIIGVVTVGNEVGPLQRRLEKVVDAVERDGRSVIVDYRVEFIS